VLSLAVQIALRAERKGDAGEYLASIAALQAKAGYRDDAEATIALALGALEEAEHRYHRHDILRDVVDALGAMGKFDDTVRLANSDDNGYTRGDMLGTIAQHRARTRGAADGLAILLPLPPFERHIAVRRLAWVMRYAAVERGEEGILIEALRMVDRHEQSLGSWTGVHYVAEFPPALFIVAHALAEAGRFDEALELSRSIQYEEERNAALAHIAVMEVQTGGIVASLRRILATGDASLRSKMLQQVLEGLAGNDILHSLLTVGHNEGVPVRPRHMEAAAAADLAEALSRAGAIGDMKDRAVALGIVAIAQAQSGAFSDALATAFSSPDPEARYFSLWGIATLATQAGRSAEAKFAFSEAATTAKTVNGKPDDPGLRDERLSPLAIGMARAGLVEEALDVVGEMEGNLSNSSFGVDGRIANSDYERRWALYAIAEAQARRGAVADAVATQRGIEREGEQLGHAVGVVALGFAEAGRVAEAVSLMRSETGRWKNDTLFAIAQKQVVAGRYAQALQVVEAMEDDDDKAAALATIARAQSRAGLNADATATYAGALRMMQSMRYVSPCISGLRRIAAEMDER
jgi:tetratricopeptide (TPR) repeat protein